MAERRQNKPAPIQNRHVRHYQRWHWGIPATQVIEWHDRDFPESLIEIGRLVELHLIRPGKTKEQVLAIPKGDVPNTHIAFDPDHPSQRVYLLVGSSLRRALKHTFWKPDGDVYDLNDVAVEVGGRHGKRNYLRIPVQIVGTLTHVVYRTKKKGDDADYKAGKITGTGSEYIHEMGEEGGIPPELCIDSTGRLWVAGGSYTSPTPGLTH